ncbi:hypothetical protein IPG36_04725 [bacterium]|nr:MAG: hypothetical protein IPG36_04725 [bacterium]
MNLVEAEFLIEVYRLLLVGIIQCYVAKVIHACILPASADQTSFALEDLLLSYDIV